MIYADDSEILFSRKHVNVISDNISETFESCSAWKKKSILFGPPRKLECVTVFKITCNGHTISSPCSVKYLALFICKIFIK